VPFEEGIDMSPCEEEERAVAGLLVVLLRALRHWPQAELARASGIQKSQISLYELWKVRPTEANLRRLAAAAGVTWAEARLALPALRALYRLTTKPAAPRRELSGARRMAAAVGRAATGAFAGSVRPFLQRRLLTLTWPGQPAPGPPPDKEMPAALGLLVVLLRSLRHWSQVELAGSSGVQRSQISAYELGKTAPRKKTLGRLAAAVGVPLEEALAVLPVLCDLLQAVVRGAGERAALAETAGKIAADLFLLTVEPVLPKRLPVLAGQAAVQEARRQADIRCLELMRRPADERWRLVEEYEAYQTWALCETMALESEKCAAHDPDVAMDLARLAVRMAELTRGSREWRARVGGRCWGYLANAYRVKGDFLAAEEAFVRSDRLWQAGAAADPGLLLDGTRLLDLKASLRRHQGQFQESLDLLDQALTESRSAQDTARLLLKKSATLEQMGDWQGAIEVLQQARPLVESRGDPRERFGLEYNLCRSLTDAGRLAEAAALLPKVKGLALQIGNGLDLLRCRWLQGLVAAGLGHLEEAAADLEAVAGELAALAIAFDAAQASLDVAVIYLRQGRSAEVKRLAGQIVAVFQAQRVHHEALAAVIVFQMAAEQERATAELVKKLSDFLRRAQHAPGLRFEP
jgi:transcriptional regulator with XRE-family HTH domain